MFMTETEAGTTNIDDLIKSAPFSFEYVPTKTIMHKLIVKATQIKKLKDFENS
jgi:hypothetical protein